MPLPPALQKFINDSIALPDTVHVRLGDWGIGGVDRTVVVHPGATLRFRPGESITTSAETIIVLEGGTLEMKPASPDVKHEIVFRDLPFDDVLDPQHFGHGLICLGKCLIAGSLKRSFIRAAGDLRAGITSLPMLIPEPVPGWRTGDRLVIPDSRSLGENERAANYVPKWEVRTLRDAATCALDTPLQYDHPSRTTPDGDIVLRPHIGNLTRNVVVRSENDHGNRGYVYFRDKADVDVTNCEFESLGRSRIGGADPWRYPVQFVSLRTHPRFSKNSIWCALDPHDCRFKWPLTIHDTHHGDFSRNVIHNWAGAGVALTNGNETRNVINYNLVTGTRGYSNPRSNDGDDGSAFWLRGWLSELRGNIAAGAGSYFGGIVAGCGFNLFSAAAQSWTTGMAVSSPDYDFIVWNRLDMRQTPIRGFDGNEAYGCRTGLTIWNLGTDGYKSFPIEKSFIRQFRAWNCFDEAFLAYPVHNLEFVEGEFIYCGEGWDSQDYWASDCAIRRTKIIGCNNGAVGTNTSGAFLLEDCDFQVSGAGVLVQTLATPGSGAYCPGRVTRVVNCRHKPMPGRSLTTIRTSFDTSKNNTQLFQKNLTEVRSHNGIEGDDFDVYFPQSKAEFVIPNHQAPSWQVPQPSVVAGMTNAQAWAAGQGAIAGGIAPPETTTRPDVAGLVKQLRVPLPPPVNRPPVVDAGPDQTVPWDMRGAIQMAGTVDDTDSAAVLTVAWTLLSGPGGFVFANTTSPASRALATGPGEYVLRLLASDGELTATDTVTITVLPAPVPEPLMVSVPAAELAVVRGGIEAMLEKMKGWQ